MTSVLNRLTELPGETTEQLLKAMESPSKPWFLSSNEVYKFVVDAAASVPQGKAAMDRIITMIGDLTKFVNEKTSAHVEVLDLPAFHDLLTRLDTVVVDHCNVVDGKFDECRQKLAISVRKLMDSIVENKKMAVSKLEEAKNKIDATNKEVQEKLWAAKDDLTGKYTDVKIQVTDKINSVKEDISGKFNEAKNAVNHKIQSTTNSLSDKYDSYKSDVQHLYEEVQEQVEPVTARARSWSKDLLVTRYEQAYDLFRQLVDRAKENFPQAVATIQYVVAELPMAAVHKANDVAVASVDTLKEQPRAWFTYGLSLLKPMLLTAQPYVHTVYEKAKVKATPYITQAVEVSQPYVVQARPYIDPLVTRAENLNTKLQEHAMVGPYVSFANKQAHIALETAQVAYEEALHYVEHDGSRGEEVEVADTAADLQPEDVSDVPSPVVPSSSGATGAVGEAKTISEQDLILKGEASFHKPDLLANVKVMQSSNNKNKEGEGDGHRGGGGGGKQKSSSSSHGGSSSGGPGAGMDPARRGRGQQQPHQGGTGGGVKAPDLIAGQSGGHQ